MSFKITNCLLLVLCLISVSSIGKAETTLVAVASNFTRPMKEIAEAFEKTTGHSALAEFEYRFNRRLKPMALVPRLVYVSVLTNLCRDGC